MSWCPFNNQRSVMDVERIDFGAMGAFTGVDQSELRSGPDARPRKKWLEAATTPDEAWQVYYHTPRGSQAEEAALQKLLDLATTPTEVCKVCAQAPRGSAVKKAVCQKMLDLATKPDEAEALYDEAPSRSPIAGAAIG
jgi:phosphotransferase system HPr-like phosphotransfer protein